MDVIYFICPTEESVNAAIQDYKGKPAYANAHFFFVSALPESLFKRITSSPIAPKIKNFKELFIDFLAFESQVTPHSPRSFHSICLSLSTRSIRQTRGFSLAAWIKCRVK